MPAESIPSALRRQIIDRDGGACLKCGRTEYLEVNHVHLKMDGGSNDPENLSTLCHACHTEWHSLEERSTYPYDRWLQHPPLSILLIVIDTLKANPEAGRHVVELLNSDEKFGGLVEFMAMLNASGVALPSGSAI